MAGYYYSLLSASIQSCSHVVILCLIGYVAAMIGIMNDSIQKGLSSMIIKIFMPCLLFSNIAADIDLDTLIRLWPIPALYLVFAVLSGSLGVIGGKLLNLSTASTKFVMTSIIFNNVTSLSLGLLEGVGSTTAIKVLFRDENDSPKEAVTRGMSYILLATLLGNLSRWSLGAYLLKKETDEEVVDINTNPTLPVYQNPNEQNSANSASGLSERTPLLPPNEHEHEHVFIKSTEKNSVTNIGVRIWKFIRGAFRPIARVMNPPLYAAIFALIVGTIPSLKGIFFGMEAPLYTTFTRTTQHLGKISVPLTLLTLGAQIRTLPRVKTKEILPQLSWMMICRFIIMPTIGIIIIMNTINYYLDDPMLWFVLMLMASGPPAVNCMNLTHLTGTFQEEMATLLFYSYAAVAPLMAIAVMIMLTLIGNEVQK